MTEPDSEAERERLARKREVEERQSLRLHGAIGAFIMAGFGYLWYFGGLGQEVADMLASVVPKSWATVIVLIAGLVMLYMMWMRMIYDVDGREDRRLQRIIDKINQRKK